MPCLKAPSPQLLETEIRRLDRLHGCTETPENISKCEYMKNLVSEELSPKLEFDVKNGKIIYTSIDGNSEEFSSVLKAMFDCCFSNDFCLFVYVPDELVYTFDKIIVKGTETIRDFRVAVIRMSHKAVVCKMKCFKELERKEEEIRPLEVDDELK